MAIEASEAGGAWQFSGFASKASTTVAECANATSSSAVLERTKAAHESTSNFVPEVEGWLLEIHGFANA